MLMKLLFSIKDEELSAQLSFSRSAVFRELVVCGVTVPGFFLSLAMLSPQCNYLAT
jgi:hypothetical protein